MEFHFDVLLSHNDAAGSHFDHLPLLSSSERRPSFSQCPSSKEGFFLRVGRDAHDIDLGLKPGKLVLDLPATLRDRSVMSGEV
ncbi:MAG: hypothetical protein ACOY9C_12890, partial [Pseudomonadota bacterium]